MIKVKIGPYHKRGVVGLEADIRIAFPDNLPPYRKRKKIPTEKDGSQKSPAKAKEWATHLAVTIAKQGRPKKKSTLPPLPPRCITFGEFVPRYLREYVAAEGLAKGTVDLRESQMGLYFLPLFKDTPLDQIDAAHLAKLKASLAKKAYDEDRSVRHRNDLMHTFYQMLKLAKVWNLLKEVPPKPKRIKAPLREIEIYTDEELSRLKVSARKVGPVVYLMVLLGCEAGLRVGEMLGLRWVDIDLVAKRLLVRQQEQSPGEVKPPKGQKGRAIALTDVLHEALKAAQHLGERVLMRTDGKPMQRQVIKAWLHRAERIGKLIGHKSPHKLRHTFASRLLARGASIKAVQILLGHASLQSTMGYLHLQPTEAEAAIRKLSGDVGETEKEREES